ncbi:extracellular solute-binding protein [Natrialbaceae archaeon A-CW3]
MSERTSQGSGRSNSSVSRRTFVKAAGASGAAATLAGCIYGSDDGSGDAVVVGLGPNVINEVGDEVVDLFHENGADGIDIELQAGDDDTGARRDNYTNLLQADEAEPDLLLMDNGWVNVFIQRGQIANLSDELDDDDLSQVEDEYFESFTATAREPTSNDLYGIPIFPDYPTMQYRKDYARDAGFDESDFETWATEPMTWQEWADVTEQIVENSDASYGLATQWDIYEGTSCCTWNEVMSSFGGAYFGGRDNLFGPIGERPVTVDEPEFIDGLRMMRTLVAEEHDEHTSDEYPTGIAPDSILGWNEENAREAILNGDAAMQRNWPYAINLNVQGEDDPIPIDDYGAMPIPYAVSESEANQQGTGGSTSALGGWHLTLNPSSERTGDAVEVLRAAMTDDFNLGMFELWGWVPPKPHLFDTEEAENVEPMGHYMDTLRVAGENAMPRPVTTVWPDQSELIAEEVNSAVSGDKSPEDAASDLQEGLEATEE